MQIHRVLRNSKTYKTLFIFAVLLPFSLLLDDIDSKEQMINCLVSLGPICYLIAYKIFDKRILAKYNRHLCFYTKYSTEKESIQSTWQEFLYQMFLFFIPILLILIGKLFIVILIE